MTGKLNVLFKGAFSRKVVEKHYDYKLILTGANIGKKM